MTDPDIEGLAEDLRRWVTAPWWRRGWTWLRRRHHLREALLEVLGAIECARLDLRDVRKINEKRYACIADLVARLQGLTGMVRELVVPEHQDRFVATMYDAIDVASAGVGGLPFAKPQTSTATTPLKCSGCGQTSQTKPGLRFYQGAAGVECFDCLGVEPT
ncbi:MAG: hypothetical protein Q8Q14_09995 [Gemmatimonadales bacterium]|nr:hypothetical protein [Gemmatimonadales bacterium]